MATYKLIQDIEAEDHILGPLSLRQFLFALGAVFCFYMTYLGIAKGIFIIWMLFLPAGLVLAFFAFPFGGDQPTEIWALAKIRFLLKPRKRIWNQTGIKDLVTVTAPKKIEVVRTDGLSQTEVKSRLQALANTIDSRGWAVKNLAVGVVDDNSDRLVDVGIMPQEVPNYEVSASDDVLDEVNNPLAQQFDQMISQSTQQHRQEVIDRMNQTTPTTAATAPANNWFMRPQVSPGPMPVAPIPAEPSADEAALAAQIKQASSSQDISYDNMRTLQPTQAQQAEASSPPPTDPAILSLASNDDLNVATLAREAEKAKGDSSDGEVVISLR